MAGDLDPKALGVRPGLRKREILPNLSPPGFWGRGVVSHLFGIRTMRQTKRGEQNFNFRPTPQGNVAHRQGWRGGGAANIWNFNIYYKRDPPKIRRQLLLVLCNFMIRRISRAPRVPPGPGRG